MPRIVSLISSATEILNALGAIDWLVGRSHECDYPERVLSLPVCTRPRIAVGADSREIDRQVKEAVRTSISIYDVFGDVIEHLEPTHILTQIQCEVCAVSLRDVESAIARGMKGHPEIVSLQPDSLADICGDFRRVGQAIGIAEHAERVIEGLNSRLIPMKPTGQSLACIEWMEPLMAAGNWTPELVRLAGGIDLFGQAGRHSPWITWEKLAAADPEVIVVAPCGFDLARTERELYWLTQRPEWPLLRAVSSGRVLLADGNRYFNRPGPSVVDTYEVLVEMLHPEMGLFRHRGRAWRTFGSG